MKILTFTSLYPSVSRGEFGIFVRRRTEALGRLEATRVVAPVPLVPFGLSVIFPKYCDIADTPNEEMQNGVIVTHPRYFILPSIGRRYYGEWLFRSVMRHVSTVRREFHFDILDCHWGYPDGYAGMLLSRKFKVPYTVTLRGSDILIYAKQKLIGELTGLALRNASAVICVSASMVPDVISMGVRENKIHVVSNGIDNKRFFPKPEEREPGNILYVGRLGSPKRLDLLLEAIAILGRDTMCKLTVVGDGPQSAVLKTKAATLGISEKVSFVGSVPNNELPAYYRKAHIFCLPSDSEGNPNVLLEALSCGTPVVANAVGGIPEIVALPGL